ncbi:MAG: polysaccharide deacetylase family protein, partial [Alphaproteobacteria bacterium]|nr:polysaccharide deacetylase family protein [Alphaproteobacteria bacterium]
KYGMDHDRYDWSVMFERQPVTWPNGARVALWVIPTVEWFPLDMENTPFKVPGAPERVYPDYWTYTLRDYGTRIGIYRIMRVLDDLGIKGSVALNSAIAERHPYLVEQINKRGWEIIAHGVDMDKTHHGDLPIDEETQLVEGSLKVLRELSGQDIRGWLSPAKSQSMNTPDLAAAQGIEYMCDWANDEMPYPFRTKSGEILAMPHPLEMDDQHILINLRQSEEEFVAQVQDQFDWLYNEAADGNGRIMAISLHSWVSGQAFRVKPLAEALGYIMNHKGVWSATGGEIVDAIRLERR